MPSAKVKKFFDALQITKWVWRENEYSLSVICNNPNLWGKGVFYLDDLWGTWANKMSKYLVYQDKLMTAKDFFDINKADFSKFDWFMGIDIATGEPFKVNFIKQLHTLIGGTTWSWKSVTLYFILYQLFQNPYTELYILDKKDFDFLSWTGKVVYRGSSLEMNGKSFFNFIKYFWLEQDRRNKIFKKYWVRDWADYTENVMWKVEWAPIINYSYIIMDEYQTLRKMVSDSIGEEKFDNEIKKLLDTVRAAWMCFFFWTQDYQKKQIWDMRDSVKNGFFGKMGYCDVLVWKELQNIKLNIEGTFLFYHSLSKKFLKIPYVEDTTEALKTLSNDPKNRITDNPSYLTTHEMLNDLLEKADSDIFYDVEGLTTFLQLKSSYIEKLKKTADYLPFMVLLYVLWRGIQWWTMNRTFNIFSSINFEKEIDQLLFAAIDFFNDEVKFLKLLSETFEASWDEEEFIQKLSDVLNNYLKHILWDTRISFWNPSSVKKVVKELTEEEQFLKDKAILEVSFSWEIKPQSVNSMYFVDKNTDMVRKTQSADNYEDKLKNLIVQRMQAREIKQYNWKVLLDIWFEVELSENKNGNLSWKWRLDLDNLMKATIDSISKTIIKDDNLVYWIRAKMSYKPKSESTLTKNNRVKIKVYPYEDELLKIFEDSYASYEKVSDFSHSMSINDGINIPSYNSMYNIINGKKVASTNTTAYKRILKEAYLNANWLSDVSKGTMAMKWTLGVYNDEQRDLDNMLKATIDSFTWIVYTDDKQILEFFVKKEHVEWLSWKLDLEFYNISDDSDHVRNRPPSFEDETDNVIYEDVNDDNQSIDIASDMEEWQTL